MLNRYQGNTGRVVRIDDSQPPRSGVLPGAGSGMPGANPRAPAPAPVSDGRPSSPLMALLGGGKAAGGIFDRLSRLVPGKLSSIGELETEDIILLLILYLMYRESGDSELLIILGAMFLLD